MSGRAEALRIRIAQPKERPSLEDLQSRASMALPEYRERIAADPGSIELPAEQVESGQVLVADYEGRIAGFAAVVGGELDGPYVEPALRRRGIGRALAEAAALLARRRGLSLTVTANAAALGFYESCGFTVEDEVPTRFGPAFRMSR